MMDIIGHCMCVRVQQYITPLASKSKECPRSHVNCHPSRRRGWQTYDLKHSLFSPMVRIRFFCLARPKMQSSRSGAFRPARQKIEYYAPREEKTWTVHNSCKLTPEPKAKVANTSCGLANFTPVERILCFLTSRPKMPYFRFGAGREWSTFGSVWGKIILIEFYHYLIIEGSKIKFSFIPYIIFKIIKNSKIFSYFYRTIYKFGLLNSLRWLQRFLKPINIKKEKSESKAEISSFYWCVSHLGSPSKWKRKKMLKLVLSTQAIMGEVQFYI